MSSVLRTENLVKIYKKRKVVDGVSISVKQGEIVGLLGPNGAGKTTTFYMIVGAIKPNGGKVYLDNRDITKLPMFKRARLGIGYLPQEPSIFRYLSVWDNIYGVLEMRGYNKKEARKLTEEVIELLNLKKVVKNLGIQLSGGERRRVEVARAVVLKPKFLLLDEPFAAVDPKTREEIQEIVLKLKDMGIGIIITDHNVRETLEITDRAYIIYEGKILIEGSTQQLINDPKAREIYLGEKFRM
ncbi:LPS export ABC transporter ATP-binding protein [Candidatus Caldipriscus sp.]|nr:LPS export ABC transporter ATP-binding protein [Candidatus Caldipriscus sp.]